jgi:hypothetical protein
MFSLDPLPEDKLPVLVREWLVNMLTVMSQVIM